MKRLLVLLVLLFCIPAFAQDTRISVAAVTKYTGAPSPAEVQHGQDFLMTLETQLAASLVGAKDVDYLDRSNLDALLREVHLSSNSVFDQSSGALRGLLGRLDFLIVIEASTATTARVRVVNVETGAVKGIAICEVPTNFFGLPSKATPDCVPRVLEQTVAAAKAQSAVKQNRLAKAAAERQAEEQAKAERGKKAASQQQEADRKRAGQERAAKEQKAENDRRRAEAEDADRKQQAEIERQLDVLRPRYDDATARISAESARWEGVRRSLASSGLGLRSDVESTLSNARRTADRCSGLLSSRNPEQLSNCLNRLDNILYQLGQYR